MVLDILGIVTERDGKKLQNIEEGTVKIPQP
jgi:hypothetical protein